MQSESRVVFFLIAASCRVAAATENFQTRLPGLRESVNSGLVDSSRIDNTTSWVTINRAEYEIYVFDAGQIDGAQNHEKTLSKLYTCINCEFADWARTALYKFVRRFPVSVSTYVADVAEDKLFRRNYETAVADLNRVLELTERFVDVLYNFSNGFRNDSTVDQHLLGALLTFNWKINCATASVDRASDSEMVGITLEAINSIQNFVALNCGLPTSFYENNNLALFAREDIESNDGRITTFLSNIAPIGLESYVHCTSKRWWSLLHSDGIREELGRVLWKTDDGDIRVDDVIIKMKTSHVLQLNFWYEKQFLYTIMKILFTKALGYFTSSKTFNSQLVDAFKDLYSYVLFEYGEVSDGLNTCFTILISQNTESTFSECSPTLNVITEYINSLQNIVLDTTESEYKTFSVDRIVQNIEDFKCFMHTVGLFINENSLSYMPFNNTPIKSGAVKDSAEKVKDPRKTNKNDDKQRYSLDCSLIRNLYLLCLESIFSLNFANSRIGDDRAFFYNETYTIITLIKNSLLKLSSNDFDFARFITIITHVVPLIDRENSKLESLDYFDIKRLIYLIVTELNRYALEHCNPPQNQFLLFNNTNFGAMGLLDIVINETKKILSELTNSTFIDLYHTEKVLSITNFFTDYENHRPVELEMYDDVIQFVWKGEKKKIKEIYEIISSTVMSSLYLYAFYDLNLKFSMAAFYYELNKLVKNTKNLYEILTSKYKSIFITEILNALDNNFPEYFNSTITEIKKHTTDVLDIVLKNNGDGQKLNGIDTETLFKVKLEKIGIFVDFKKTRKLKTLDEKNVDTEIMIPLKLFYDTVNGYITKIKDFIEIINKNMKNLFVSN